MLIGSEKIRHCFSAVTLKRNAKNGSVFLYVSYTLVAVVQDVFTWNLLESFHTAFKQNDVFGFITALKHDSSLVHDFGYNNIIKGKAHYC